MEDTKRRKIALVDIHHTCWLVIGHDYSRKVRLMWMSRVVLIVCFCVKGRQKRKKVLENVVELATYTYLTSHRWREREMMMMMITV